MSQVVSDMDYRRVTAIMIKELCRVHYDGLTNERVRPLTQISIAECLGVTATTISRAATGVTSLSGPIFLSLYRLYVSRLSNTIGYKTLFDL